MPKSIYITGIEPGCGKTVVALGFMEQLSARVKTVGLFRPLVSGNGVPDRIIELMKEQYHLAFPAEDFSGMPIDAALSFIADGNYEELFARILERYKNLENRCDSVLCIGTDYTGVSKSLEFDFNVEVARNLGAALVPVMDGRGKSAAALGRSARELLELLENRKCDTLAVVINRAEPGVDVGAVMQGERPCPRPVYVLTREPLLEHPSVRDIARDLGARMINGEDASLDGEVRTVKIAAMELPHFLDHLEEGSLVITPGDRSDIILGTLVADRSSTYPRVAGIVLTGNLRPAPQVQRLLDGLRSSPVPVMSVATDTFTTATAVNTVRPSLAAGNKRKIAAALGLMESSADLAAVLERTTVTPSVRVTPLMFQYELVRRAKQQRKHIVLPEGSEERILRAAEIILLRDVCDITLLGTSVDVGQKASGLGISLDRAKIVDPRTSDLLPDFSDTYYELRRHKGISRELARDTMQDVSYFGTMMVYKGLADGMVSGSVHTTAHTIRPALEFVKTRPGISVVSSVFFMCLADRVMVYGDCAIVPEPTAAQLADIAISSAATAQAFGIEPRVAMLSYSTGKSGSGPDVDRVREATGIIRSRVKDLKVEGPIQYDAAVDATVAKVKMPDSEVAGHATVFIFPDLSAGNNAYKAVQRAANAVAIGPVLQGLKKPVNDLSRGALVPDIVNTIAITAIQAQG